MVRTLVSGGHDKVIILWDLRKYVSIKFIPVFEDVEGLVPTKLLEILTPTISSQDLQQCFFLEYFLRLM